MNDWVCSCGSRIDAVYTCWGYAIFAAVEEHEYIYLEPWWG